MGKDTKEMLKTINSNLEAIMKHFKIEMHVSKQTPAAKPKSVKKFAKAKKEKQKKK